MTPSAPSSGADDVQPVSNETRDRIITGAVTAVPAVGLVVAMKHAWRGLLRPVDLAVALVMYVLTGLGITVGFHRHLTHRAFDAPRPVRFALAALGSAAIEGPVVSWVADHRKHHAFADVEGDPHSPHVDHGVGLRGALRGLAHAHLGWLFIHTHRGLKTRYAPDLLEDPTIRFVDRTFLVWAVGGLALPAVVGGKRGLLWGGLVRVFALHHVTYSINSLCHFFGRRRFATEDESRNLAWLAVPSFGEAWHNNHHAFPTSARHGMHRGELDLSGLVIAGLERAGLASRVVRIAPERRAAKQDPHYTS